MSDAVISGFASYLDWAKAAAAGDAPHPPSADLIGFRMTEIGDGKARFVLEAEEKHANPMGTLHGGILCDVTDAAMSSAYASLLEPGETYTTLGLSIDFLRPFWTGDLLVKAEVVHRGRTYGTARAEVRDEQDRLIATASNSCLTLRGDQAKGR